MKRIGYTDEGGVIVVLTREEAEDIKRLAFALEGKDMMGVDFPAEPRLIDFAPAFRAIRHYATTLDMANRAARQVERWRALLTEGADG